jgi:hypothetical protein
MKHSKRAQKLLARMADIERMERGKLCRIPGRKHYNLQAWRNGKNEVRYVPEQQREAVQEAIDGYRLFTRLAEEYADEIIERTRREHNKRFPPRRTKRKKRSD